MACAAALVLCALGVSACAGGHSGAKEVSTDAIQLHESTSGPVPQKLQNFVHSIEAGSSDGPVNEIDVYGPGSRAALVKASSGEVVSESPSQRKKRFYLIVLHGQFVCGSCTGPVGAKAPQGTIETRVWAPSAGGLDFGISNSLPAAVSRLHRLAVIQLS